MKCVLSSRPQPVSSLLTKCKFCPAFLGLFPQGIISVGLWPLSSRGTFLYSSEVMGFRNEDACPHGPYHP